MYYQTSFLWFQIMALINCRECGAKVSDSAKACPSCGIGDPALNNMWLIGGVFSQIVGAFLIFVGIMIWMLLPFAFALPVIAVGVVMCFAPQLGFVLLAALIIYSLLGDIKSVLDAARLSFLNSGYADLLKFIGPATVGVAWGYYQYNEAKNCDPIACVNQKKSLANFAHSFAGTFQELASRVRAAKDKLGADIHMVDGNNRTIILSDGLSLWSFGYVYAIKLDQMDNVVVDVYAKVGEKEGFLFAKRSLKKLTRVIFH